MPDPSPYNSCSPERVEAAEQQERGLRCFDAGKPQEALAFFEKAAALDPTFARAYRNQGIAFQILNRTVEAVAAFERALALGPSDSDTHLRLGQLYSGLHRNKEAIQCFRECVALDPGNVNAHILLAWRLPKEGHGPEAEAHLRKAIELNPDGSVAYGMLGFRLQERGSFEEAITNFENGIRLNPKQAGSYFGITQSKKISESDQSLIDAMRSLASDPRLTAEDYIFLHYALGKALDDVGEYGEAIRHFDEANLVSARVNSKPYNKKGYANYVDRTIELFGARFFTKHAGIGPTNDKPIFIVGMPRSGTTLVEQVISSHPKVGAGGELRFWRDDAEAFRQELYRSVTDRASIGDAATKYLKLLDSIQPNKKFVTDKMPINFLFLGAIHLAFPRARIIHCKRNALDTCLSIYMTRYVTPPEFANDRGNIVFGYKQYERLMAHWRSVLPPKNLLEVGYEALIADRSSETRRMVEFLELPWDEACMHPEDNERPVTTPSLWQVRQPVHNNSVQRWKNYEPWLGAFSELA